MASHILISPEPQPRPRSRLSDNRKSAVKYAVGFPFSGSHCALLFYLFLVVFFSVCCYSFFFFLRHMPRMPLGTAAMCATPTEAFSPHQQWNVRLVSISLLNRIQWIRLQSPFAYASLWHWKHQLSTSEGFAAKCRHCTTKLGLWAFRGEYAEFSKANRFSFLHIL